MRKILFTLAFGLPIAAFAAEGERQFELSVPAEELARVVLEAQVGEVNIAAADVTAVEIVVRLSTDDPADEGIAERLEKAKLVHEVDGDELSVKLEYNRSMLSDNDLEEHWEVRMPAALALETDLNIGAVGIDGIAGGVNVDLNIGDAEIDVPGGDIEADVNIGAIRIRTATRSPGSVELGTTIGDTSLEIDGKSAGKVSGWLGAKTVHEGDGEDDIEASVNIGEVSVRIR